MAANDSIRKTTVILPTVLYQRMRAIFMARGGERTQNALIVQMLERQITLEEKAEAARLRILKEA